MGYIIFNLNYFYFGFIVYQDPTPLEAKHPVQIAPQAPIAQTSQVQHRHRALLANIPIPEATLARLVQLDTNVPTLMDLRMHPVLLAIILLVRNKNQSSLIFFFLSFGSTKNK